MFELTLTNALKNSRERIEATVMVGGTLIWLHRDQLAAAAKRGVEIRFLFPAPDSTWIADIVEPAGISAESYGARIMANVERLRQVVPGAEIKWYSRSATTWFALVDRKTVAFKPFNVLQDVGPTITAEAEAVAYYERLFDRTWAGASAQPAATAISTPSRALRVFLCHSSLDKPKLLPLYDLLLAQGFEPWLDAKSLLPGQDWRLEIKRAIEKSDVVVACLSRNAVDRRGYMQKEIALALDVAEEQPEGAIFLVPVRLEDCPLPARLADLHSVDLSTPSGTERLLATLRLRAGTIS